jgi:hypothetical protein
MAVLLRFIPLPSGTGEVFAIPLCILSLPVSPARQNHFCVGTCVTYAYKGQGKAPRVRTPSVGTP